jgi:hypothetical protein
LLGANLLPSLPVTESAVAAPRGGAREVDTVNTALPAVLPLSVTAGGIEGAAGRRRLAPVIALHDKLHAASVKPLAGVTVMSGGG